MKKKRCAIPDWVYAHVFNELSTYHKSDAAVPKGIAAFLYSTKLCLFTLFSFYLLIRFHFTAYGYEHQTTFLFIKKLDKPCFNPGCRSPPILPFLLEFLKKGGKSIE